MVYIDPSGLSSETPSKGKVRDVMVLPNGEVLRWDEINNCYYYTGEHVERVSKDSNTKDQGYSINNNGEWGNYLAVAGAWASYKQYNSVMNNFNGTAYKWHGENGEWYSMKYYGSEEKVTGHISEAAKSAKIFQRLGRLAFAASTVYGFNQLNNDMKARNYRSAALTSADLVMGVVSTFGGPIGAIVGGVYFIGRMTIIK